MRILRIVLLLALALVALGDGSNDVGSKDKSSKTQDKDKKTKTKIGRCKNCVYVLERIKQGYHYLLPNICEEILAKTNDSKEYATWGMLVKQWLHQGCYKVEPYGALSHVQPCPSHVICSKITDLQQQSFCATVKTDFEDAGPDDSSDSKSKDKKSPSASSDKKPQQTKK